MKIINNVVATGTPKSGSAGNQNRVFNGISGTEYDMSFQAKIAEAADNGLNTRMCSLTLRNQVNRTANNIDTRTPSEKMFAEGLKTNASTTIYFTKDQKNEIIAADKILTPYMMYRLTQIKEMESEEYKKSLSEMMKMAAVREAKSNISKMNNSYTITKAEWDRCLAETKMKANPVGINTFELNIRASSRDEDLYRENSTAWHEVDGENGDSYMAASFNAAGTKTLPLFTEEQVQRAKETSEEIYKIFLPAYEYAVANPTDYEGYFKKFIELAMELKVPEDFVPVYNMWTDAQREKISSMAAAIQRNLEV